jgi:hypothetical protein
MTRTALAAARTHAELAALVTPLRGRALQTLLDEVGLSYLRNATVVRKREALAEHFGRQLDSRAIEAMGRQLH